jgi:4-hydroxy-tetrahydrodipicolinate synthase
MEISVLKGSIPPLVTPFRGGAVDEAAYTRLVERQVAEGSHGILVNGTTAEPACLTVAERNRLVDIAVEVVAGRIPVVAATGSQSLAETEILTDHAVKAGADSLLIVTPYYTKPPQRGLVDYYLHLARRHDLPWMIYHIPGRTGVSMTLDSFRAIRRGCGNFAGMKHAATDLQLVTECLVEFGPDFRIFVGLEELSFPMMAIGACGLMNAVGNLRPALLADLCRCVWESDIPGARAIHERLLDINLAVFWDTNPIPVKYMMKRLGLLADNAHRLPMVRATPELEARLDHVLERVGLLPAATVQ